MPYLGGFSMGTFWQVFVMQDILGKGPFRRVKKNLGKSCQADRLGWPPPPSSGQENVKNFDFDFRLWFLIIYDLKRSLPKKEFFDHRPPLTPLPVVNHKQILDLSKFLILTL